MDTFIDKEYFSQIRELEGDIFNDTPRLLNDLLKIRKRDAIDRHSTTYKCIKDIVESHVNSEDCNQLSINDDFNIIRIKYRYCLEDRSSITIYLVSGVYLNIFDEEPKFKDINITKLTENCKPYIELPEYVDKETSRNYIVFSDVVNQLINRPRTLIDYNKKEMLQGLTADDEEDFVRDCYYFAYLSGLCSLTSSFSHSYYYEELTFLFIFSKIETKDYVDKYGINAVSDITDTDMKGIICSYYLFHKFIKENIGNNQFETFLNKINSYGVKYAINNIFIHNGGIRYTEKIMKVMEVLSCKEFLNLNTLLEKVAYLFKNNISTLKELNVHG